MNKLFLAFIATFFLISVASAQTFTSNVEAGKQDQCIAEIKKIENREAISEVKEKASIGKGGFVAITFANPCDALNKFDVFSGKKYIQSETTSFQGQMITIYQIYIETD